MSPVSRETEDARAGELDFNSVREQLEKEIEDHLGQSGQSVQESPRFILEKGIVRFSFMPDRFEKEWLYDALNVIKFHIENLRIHTFEPGYIIFQDMGPNLYDTSGHRLGIKFKFSSLGGGYRVEVTRKANLIQDEVQACVNLFKLFHPVERHDDPFALFNKLGVSVFHKPIQAESAEGESPSGAGGTDFKTATDFVAGYEKTKTEIRESVILPLQNPEIFQGVARLTRGSATGNLPKAVLFEGPPGVGKTTMARIIARQTGFPLVYVPVENILSKYYGESAQNMAAIFDAAYHLERVILFLDEIDSLAGSRKDGLFEATRRILAVLLRKIDGFESRIGVLTIGATNRAQDLDPALFSRFDHVISFPLPNQVERSAIYAGYAHQLTPEDLNNLAAASDGLSGRNIQDICEYAERRWARLLIAKGEVLSAPPGHLYLEITREKLRQEEFAPS